MKSKYVGVRQRASGKWVAEIKDTTKKIRMWLGTFDSAEEAARAYDEAAFLLRGSNTRTNFATHVSPNPGLSLKIRNLLSLKDKGSKRGATSTTTTTTVKPITSVIATSSSCSIVSNTSSFSPHYNTSTNSSCSSASKNLNGQMFDDAYKRDMRSFVEELQPATMRCSSNSRPLSVGFDDLSYKLNTEGIELTEGLNLSSNQADLEVMELESINVEISRSQISSASLYAVNECMDINACDASSWDWDLSSFCHLYCSS